MDLREQILERKITEFLLVSNQITSLELKTALREEYPYYVWNQTFISSYLQQLCTLGFLTYNFNGNFNIYKKKRSLKEIYQLLSNSKGRFITIYYDTNETVYNIQIRKKGLSYDCYFYEKDVFSSSNYIDFLRIKFIKMNGELLLC